MTKKAEPQNFQDPGRKLWAWAREHYDVSQCEPLLGEICELADRLESVRRVNRTAATPDAKLLNSEVVLTAAYQRAWRLLGLSAKEPAAKGKPGRKVGVALKKPDQTVKINSFLALRRG